MECFFSLLEGQRVIAASWKSAYSPVAGWAGVSLGAPFTGRRAGGGGRVFGGTPPAAGGVRGAQYCWDMFVAPTVRRPSPTVGVCTAIGKRSRRSIGVYCRFS